MRKEVVVKIRQGALIEKKDQKIQSILASPKSDFSTWLSPVSMAKAYKVSY